MIGRIDLLHYLSRGTYEAVARHLGLNAEERRAKDNKAVFPEGAIADIELFNIQYEQFGHIWFMNAGLCFPRFACGYEGFERALYAQYARLLGGTLAAQLPPYGELTCSYIKYEGVLAVADADEALEGLRKRGFSAAQLHKRGWPSYKKPHGTIEFCLDKLDGGHLSTLARCHGTALKKRIKDTAFHNTVGLLPEKAVSLETEREILAWLYLKNGLDCRP